MATIIIAKNNTAGAIFIQDLGIEIPGSGNRTLTSTFSKTEISTSADLASYVLSGDIIINDGSSDLSVSNGLAHINFETQYEDVDPTDSTSFVNHSIESHLNYSGSPQGQNILKYNSLTGKWGPSPMIEQTDEPPTDSTSEIWIDPVDLMPFFFDPNVGSWVTIDRTVFTFGRSGNADGSYLAIGGWSSSGYYYIHRPATMTAIYCKSTSGQQGKTFQVQRNGNIIHEFTQTNYKYVNTSLAIDLSTDDLIQVFVTSTGTPISDTVCQVEVAWRYVP